MNENELSVAAFGKWNNAAAHAAAHGCCQRMFNPQTLAKWRAKTEPVLCFDGCELRRQHEGKWMPHAEVTCMNTQSGALKDPTLAVTYYTVCKCDPSHQAHLMPRKPPGETAVSLCFHT